MKYFTVVRNATQFERTIQQLYVLGKEHTNITWKEVCHEDIPCVVWYDTRNYIEWCDKDWLVANGYKEKNLNIDVLPDNLFEI